MKSNVQGSAGTQDLHDREPGTAPVWNVETALTLLNSTADQMCWRDGAGALVAWNTAFARGCEAALGVEPRVGLKTVEYVSPEQRARLEPQRALFCRVLSGEMVESEFEYTSPDGEQRFYEIHWAPVWADGQVVGVTEATRDVTTRKRGERRLRETEERFRALMRNTVETVCCVDLEKPLDLSLPEDAQLEHFYKYAYFTEANDALARQTGHERGADMIGIRVAEFAPRSVPQNEESVRAAVRSRFQIQGIETEEEWPNGTRRVARNNIMGEVVDNHLIRFWATDQDVTEQRALEQELRDSESRYRTVADFTYDWEYWQAPDGRLLYVSPSCERVTGHLPEEFEADPGLLRRIIHPEDLDRWDRHVRDLDRGGRPPRIQFRVRKNGEIAWIEHACLPVVDGGGEFLGYRASNRDVTVQRASDDRLRDSRAQLEKNQQELRALTGQLLTAQEEERSRLARELHDDLTQRLAVMSIEAGLLANQAGVEEPVRQKLEGLKGQLIALSTDVHALSRQLHPAVLDDLGLVQAIRSECERVSRHEGIRVEFEAEGVSADIPRDIGLCFYRVAQEALRNVVKHACAEEARVRLHMEEETLHLRVVDTGIGFDTEHGPGTFTLGLASMVERARLIGAELRVDSHPGAGTTVELGSQVLEGQRG